MPNIRTTVIAGYMVEIREYHAAHIGRKDRRGIKKNPSSIAMQKVNERNTEKRLNWLLCCNFRHGIDAFVTLGYRHNSKKPQSLSELQKDVRCFFRKLRNAYRKQGKVLKYVYTLEIGSRGGIHVHAVISDADRRVIDTCWCGGSVNIESLQQPESAEGFERLAAYMIKNRTHGEWREKTGKKRFYTSRNLEQPDIKRERILESDIGKPPIIVQGYILDKGSVITGISEITNRPYREYRLFKDETIQTNKQTKYTSKQNPAAVRACILKRLKEPFKRLKTAAGDIWINKKSDAKRTKKQH